MSTLTANPDSRGTAKSRCGVGKCAGLEMIRIKEVE